MAHSIEAWDRDEIKNPLGSLQINGGEDDRGWRSSTEGCVQG